MKKLVPFVFGLSLLLVMWAGPALAVMCAPPTGVTVPVSAVDGNYTVSWEASVTGDVGYIVEEAINSTFTAGRRTVYAGIDLSTTITGAVRGKSYWYRVKAWQRGYMDSAWQTGGNGCTVPRPTLAGQPGPLTVPATDADGAYEVSWEASETEGVSYLLQEATDPAFTSGRVNYRAVGLSKAITGRVLGTTYYYRVKAQKAGLPDSAWRVGGNGCQVVQDGPEPTVTNTLGMAFNLISAGTFTMGSPGDELGRDSDEGPQHEVTLSQVYMQTTEVTQGQWRAVMGSNPAHFSSCGDGCPVEGVSWDEIQAFITVLNQRGEGTYRLPTEAEWEYAARAGSITAFANGEITQSSGNDPNLNLIGWYNENADRTTHQVGLKQANDWGLYDMHGNVWEWVQDWYGAYGSSAVSDPQGPSTGSYRVFRGGGWIARARGCRSANRDGDTPDFRHYGLGFRLLRITEPPALVTNTLGMTFNLLPAGVFTMGSPASELGRESDEVEHEVTLSNDFYMQTTEVTQGQWRAVMGSNPSYFSSCGDGCPVEQVSWNDIQTFITTLNQRGEGTYRLPTEAEWEYAARAGSITAFANGEITQPTGNDPNLNLMGWYNQNSGSTTHPVGQKQDNDWVLYDMHGNVYELVQDRYGSYGSSAVTDPQGPVAGPYRVLRGGYWRRYAGSCRSANRSISTPTNRTSFIVGFRLMRTH